MVPLNLMTKHKRAYYVNTGMWSKKAIAEAKKIGEVIVPASSEDRTFSYIPELDADMFKGDADYVHITSNNTIYGTRYIKLPDTGGLPIVTDMSSCILSEVINVNDYGVIYGGAEEYRPAGLTVVIIADLIGRRRRTFPRCWTTRRTRTMVRCITRRPLTFTCGAVFEYLLKNGGIPPCRS